MVIHYDFKEAKKRSRLKPAEVERAYLEMAWLPTMGLWVHCKTKGENIQVTCGCPMATVMAVQHRDELQKVIDSRSSSDVTNLEGEVAAALNRFANDKYGKDYVDGFTNGFDGYACREEDASFSEARFKTGWQDGVECLGYFSEKQRLHRRKLSDTSTDADNRYYRIVPTTIEEALEHVPTK